MSDDIKTVQMTYGEAMEALWRRGQAIKKLQAENEKLRAALKPFAKCVATYPNAEDDYEIGFGCVHDAECKVFIRDFRAAAAALKETGDE